MRSRASGQPTTPFSHARPEHTPLLTLLTPPNHIRKRKLNTHPSFNTKHERRA